MTKEKFPLAICMFSNLFPPIPSGSSTFTWELARRIAALGHQVSVVTARVGNAPTCEEVEGVRVHRLPAMRLPPLPLTHNFRWMTYTFTSKNLRSLRELFDRERFDVIHQQNHVFDTILSSAWLARRYGIPLALTVHTWAQHPNPLFDRILMVLDELSRRVIFQEASAVVSPDPVMKRYVAVRHRILDSPVIPYGIEISPARPADIQQLRQELGLDAGPVILSLGHVNRLRTREDLIRAMPLVLQRFPNSRLLIVGEVDVQEPVELVKQLALENSVVFTGAVPRSRIPTFFGLSHLEAHTANSQYPGPGLASLEAMAAGLPVVTGEIGAQYDFSHLRNWENVVMVPPNHPHAMADALIRLLSDQGLRQSMGENAHRTMRDRYSWDAVCGAYVALYRQLIEQKHAGMADSR